MDKPISVGDLVMVVRDCCGRSLGRISVVSHVNHGGTSCEECGYEAFDRPAARLSAYIRPGKNSGWQLLSNLKRLDPDAINDDVPAKEELTV